MTGEGQQGSTENFIIPSAVLFNGGTMKAAQLRKRLLEQIESWREILGGDGSVLELDGADYDYAVSRGAVYYASARTGKAIRIKAGTARSYFIGVEEAAPAIPGRQPKLRAICVVPHGMEEGSEATLETQQFALVVGERATFRFFSHATAALREGTIPVIGTTVNDWQEQLSELPPIESLMERGDDDGKVVRVQLHSRVTELGTLELWCQAPDGRRWKLEFDLRAGAVLV